MKHIVYKDNTLYRYLETDDETVVTFAEGVFSREFSSKEKAYTTYNISEFNTDTFEASLPQPPEFDINE